VTGVPSTRVVLPPAVLHDGRLDLDGLRAELAAPGPFPPEALAEAEAAARAPRLPDVDRTDLPLVTIDPPGSMDLDQALHLARAGTGYRLSYAIADVGAFVTAGGSARRGGRAPRGDAVRAGRPGAAAPAGAR
jgi:exoribonuclease R